LPGEAGPISAEKGPSGPGHAVGGIRRVANRAKPDIATIAETDGVGFRTAGEAGPISAEKGRQAPVTQ
jgi:hypothetical protein